MYTSVWRHGLTKSETVSRVTVFWVSCQGERLLRISPNQDFVRESAIEMMPADVKASVYTWTFRCQR